MPEPHYRYLGKSGFPHANNIDVYKYDNDLDYGRYDYSQMTVQVCSVNWDQGEAHIGNRTLEGIGNVVYFGSEKARDAWFDAIPDTECFRWETRFKELHQDYSLKVPLPFDVAARYNYVRVSYDLFANDGSSVEYEGTGGVREWFYFIREVEFVAPNTTNLVLMDDAWQTWIYSIDVKSMILERGHAPLFRTSAQAYLQNPMANCADLLAKDVNFGELQQVTRSAPVDINASDMYACIVTSAYPRADFGTKAGDTWACRAGSYYDGAGVPNLYMFAVRPQELDTLLYNVTANVPQFKQTIEAVFFCSGNLLRFGDTFAFQGLQCRDVVGSATLTETIIAPSAEDWGYPDHYRSIAKLYTYPYSAYEVTDERGDTKLVRIEDTTGTIGIDLVANLVFPFLNVTGTMRGIGGSASSVVRFQNITQGSIALEGRWYEHLHQWDIPTFAVVLDAGREYDVSTHYDRIQMENDRTNTETIALRNAGTTKANADASATTASSNSQNVANAGYTAAVTEADASLTASTTQANAAQTVQNNEAANVVDNATAQTTANTAINSASNSAATSDASYVNALSQAIQAYDAGLTRATVNNNKDAANATTGISATSGVVNSAASGAISGALSGGGIGAAIGAVSGLISGGINAATSLATNAVMTEASSDNAEAGISYAQAKVTATSNNNTSRTGIANTAKTSNTSATNTAITTSANNTSATMTENATTSRNAAVSAATTVHDASVAAASTTRDASVAAAQATEATTKANDTRNLNTQTQNAYDDYANAGNRITNLVRQAQAAPPSVYGRIDHAESATTRPQALFVNVVTESDYAIQLAGDEFLRYGYYYDKQWAFDGNWNVGRHFTFWKLRDYWTSSQIPDRYADQLRFFLYGGVTVWRDPDEIGQVGIYDNGI